MTTHTTHTKTTSKIGIAALVAALLTVGGAGVAQAGRGGGFGPHREAQVQQLLEKVQATPQQRAQIGEARDRMKAELTRVHDERKRLHARALELMAAPKLDRAALETLSEQRLSLERQAQRAMIDVAVVVHAALTPAQRQQLVAEIKAAHERAKARFDGSAPF
jgi:periplasmic protein CpxP/Spy